MHRVPRLVFVLAGSAFTALAEQPGTNSVNSFSFGPRAALHISATFKNLGTLPLNPSGRTTPNGAPYNYNDGYVLADSSGSAGGQTWYWGYDAPSQISGNTIRLTRSVCSADDSVTAGDDWFDPQFGGELIYSRQLGTINKMPFGIEAACNFLNISMQDGTPFTGNVNQVTDTYAFTPGTVPPLTPPAYQGTFTGPGFVIGSTPVGSTSTPVPGLASITGHRQLDANLWGLRLGPYREFPLGRQFSWYLSGGLSLGLLDTSASWTEAIAIPGGGATSGSGNGNDVTFRWGGYVSTKVAWQFSPRWSAECVAQYQTLGIYKHNFGGREVELDLSRAVYINLQVGYQF